MSLVCDNSLIVISLLGSFGALFSVAVSDAVLPDCQLYLVSLSGANECLWA
jgi:hypothetical protein